MASIRPRTPALKEFLLGVLLISLALPGFGLGVGVATLIRARRAH